MKGENKRSRLFKGIMVTIHRFTNPTFFWFIMLEVWLFYWLGNWNSEIVPLCFWSRNAQVNHIKNNLFSTRRLWISPAFLNNQSFVGYCCQSDIWLYKNIKLCLRSHKDSRIGNYINQKKKCNINQIHTLSNIFSYRQILDIYVM